MGVAFLFYVQKEVNILNKKGHVALGILAGSVAAFLPLPYPNGWNGLLFKSVMIAVTGIAALLPDLDHKTSTSSQKIQFSAKHRKQLRIGGSIIALIGLLLQLWMLTQHWPNSVDAWARSPGIWILLLLLAHLRTLILSGAGIVLLWLYHFYDWHWITAFAGAAFLILPTVKHRGIIHTPEFATALSIGLLSFAGAESIWIQAVVLGLVVGWWAHLAGDIFGTDGIHSLFVPKVGIALRLFSNGGAAEKWIANTCWIASIGIWMYVIQQTLILI